MAARPQSSKLRILVVATAVIVVARRWGSATGGRSVVTAPLRRGATRSPVVAAVASTTVTTALATVAVVARVAVTTVVVASAVATVLRKVSQVLRLVQVIHIHRNGREGHHGGRRSAWEVRGPKELVSEQFTAMRCVVRCTYVVAVSVSTTSRAVVTLGGTEVFAGGRGSRAGAPRLLNAESPALVDLALKGVLRSVRILGSDHLDETEATALAGVWVAHNVALLDSAMLLEEDGDLFLGQARVNASDEEVGALVDLAAGLTTTGCLALAAVTVAAAVLTRRRNVTARLSVHDEFTRASGVPTARHGRCRSRRECGCRHRGQRPESESGSGHRRAGTLLEC